MIFHIVFMNTKTPSLAFRHAHHTVTIRDEVNSVLNIYRYSDFVKNFNTEYADEVVYRNIMVVS